MQIVYVTPKLDMGGTERHLLQICTQLKRNHEVSVVTLHAGGRLRPAFDQAGVKVISPPVFVPRPFTPVWSALWLTINMVRKRRTVFHYFLPEAYLVGGLCGLATRHPLQVMSRRSLNAYQAGHPFAAALERLLHRRMAAISGNSQAVMSELASEGAAADKLFLIYNGVDCPEVIPTESRALLRRELNLDPDALLIVVVANLFSYKGHDDLLAALASIADRLPTGWRLLCVGRDENRNAERYRQQAQRLGIGDHVAFLGEQRAVGRLYQAADIAVLSSHQEGFSNSLLEGMANGVASVATRVGGNPEAIEDEISGLLVPARNPPDLASALLRLSQNSDFRAQLGQAARMRMHKDFSVKRCVQRYNQLYNKILGSERLARARED